MKADILIRDGNDSSCLIEVRYNVASFDYWFSYAKPIGSGSSGDCSRWRSNLLRFEDAKSNYLILEWMMPILMPQVIMQAGHSGKGYVKSDGFLKTGDITWEIWNTRRTGKTGDNFMIVSG